jgi:hypothetical protein
MEAVHNFAKKFQLLKLVQDQKVDLNLSKES